MPQPVYMPPLKFDNPYLPMMNEFLLNSLRDNTNDLLRAIARFDFSSFNTAPRRAEWSAGDIAEHILLVEIQVGKLLMQKSEPAGRDAQDKVEEIKVRLMDRSSPIEALEALRPTSIAKDPGSFSAKILSQRKILVETVESINLFHEFKTTPNRLFGVLSGIEWINFLIYHTRRHIDQLNGLPAE